jgi:4'-phosphopantetheinyl transferase
LVLIGIGAERLGVDVEALPEPDAVPGVSGELHPSERTEVESAPPAERPQRFARVWTRKEAYLKGLGVGIATGVASEYVGAQGRAGAPSGWTVLDLEVPAGYAAAVAVAPPA